jgi:hypothetical protein
VLVSRLSVYAHYTTCPACAADAAVAAAVGTMTPATSTDTITAVAVQAVSANIYTSSTGDAALWQERSYPGSWSAVAVDASGMYMAAARSSGLIWYSQDKGATWTAIANSGSRNWVSIATSSRSLAKTQLCNDLQNSMW